MRNKIISIYKIECLINKKIYIGSSYDTIKRWNVHRCLLRKNKHHSSRLQKAWNKYGEINFNFEIIELLNSEEFMITREQYWLDLLNTYINGFNGRPKAQNSLHHKWTNEQRLAQSNRMKGKKLSDEQKKKIGLAHRGVKNNNAHLTEDIVIQIVNMSNNGKNACVIGKYFNINHSVVQDVLDRRTWCYLTENLIITKPSQKGSGHPNSKLNEQQVLEIKKRLLNGEKQKSIGNDFGVPQQTISDIKNGRSWRHLSV